jgi:hypothetical protein
VEQTLIILHHRGAMIHDGRHYNQINATRPNCNAMHVKLLKQQKLQVSPNTEHFVYAPMRLTVRELSFYNVISSKFLLLG